MSPGPTRCLLLDLGMVLIDLNYGTLGEKMKALTGLEPPQLQVMLTADGLVQRFETGKLEGTQFYHEVCRRIGISVPWPDFLEAWDSVLGQPMIHDELLAVLARKIRMWVISNTNEFHFDFLARHFSFLRHFEGFVLSHEVGALKPDARIFLSALEKMQTSASEVLFVDDQEANVKAAQDLGIGAFQFLNSGQFAAEMKSRGLY